MGHTREPWTIIANVTDPPDTWFIMRGLKHIAMITQDGRVRRKEVEANAHRIIACVNACEGIIPEAVPDLLVALEKVISRIYLPEEWEQDVADAIAKAKGEPCT